MMKRILSVLFCVILALSPVIAATSEYSFSRDPDAIEKAIESVLFILIFDEYGEIIATGSGFIAFGDRTLVTNYHVIEDASSIWASDEADNYYEIDRILAMDEEKDIAILSLITTTALVPLKLADHPTLKRGQQVITIGSPEGLVNSVSNGIISALYDRDDTPDIQFTAPISHGSSGGALFDDTGKVIGVTSAIFEAGQNLNFAIGIEHVIELYHKYDPHYSGISLSASSTPVTTLRPTQTPTAKPTQIPTAMPLVRPPDNLQVSSLGQDITLKWAEVEGANSYKVYRSVASLAAFFYRGSSTTTSFTDKNVTPGVTYHYTIASENEYLGESRQSDYISISIPTQTAIPTSSPMHTTIPTLSPTPAPFSHITQKEINQYKTLTIGMNDPGVARLKERMYELGYFNNRTVNNKYTETTAEYVKEFQRINGLKADGIASPEMQALFFSEYALSKPSPTESPKPTPKPTPQLSRPTNVKTSVSGSTVTVTWTSVKNAVEYNVYRSHGADEYYLLVATVKGNKYKDSTTVRGSSYYYKIQSVNDKNLSALTSYAKAVIPKPKPTPTPYVEPQYPLDFGNDGYVGTSRDPYINPKVINISKKKTIDGFTLTYYCTDVYGDKLFFDDTTDYTSVYTYTETLKPGRSVYPGKVSLDLYGSGIKRIYVAISKIHTTDGKTYNVPESQLDYYYWEVQ